MTAQHPDTGRSTAVTAGAHPVGPNPVQASIPQVDQQGAVTSMQGVPVTLRPAPRQADDWADPRRRGVPVNVTHVDATTPANTTMAAQVRAPIDPSAVNRVPPHTAPISAIPARPRTLGETVTGGAA